MDKPKQINEVPTAGQIRDKYLKECYDVHGEKVHIHYTSYITQAMQEHTNIHLDKFAEYVKKIKTKDLTKYDYDEDCWVMNKDKIDQLLTEYKLKNKLG